MDNKYLKEKLDTYDKNTSLNEVQNYIEEMIKIRGFQEETPQDILILLTEELGELAKEVRKMSNMKMDANKEFKSDIKGEIADVFNYLLSLCRVTNVNLLEAFKDKEYRNCNRKWE